jgi:hypothetical protein
MGAIRLGRRNEGCIIRHSLNCRAVLAAGIASRSCMRHTRTMCLRLSRKLPFRVWAVVQRFVARTFTPHR